MEKSTLKEIVKAHTMEVEGEYFVRLIYYSHEDNFRRTTFYSASDKEQAEILVQAINN